MITIEAVSKSYDGVAAPVVNQVSLSVAEGEILVILGGSGSGKTTLMKMINRLIVPDSGNIFIDNEPVQQKDPVELRRHIGYVFQKIGLLPHLTIAENVAIVLRLQRQSRERQRQKAAELLTFVGLAPELYGNRYPHELSGGQQQRVGVARALANDPKYLLMDEPFGAVDAIMRDSLQADLLALQRQLKKTIIFVTHDIFEALRLADRIAIMDRGHLLQIADKKTIIQHPANEFVRELFAKPLAQIIHLQQHKTL